MIPLFVGYQVREDHRLIDSIIDCRARIGEVYFAWPGIANGRNSRPLNRDMMDWEFLERQRADLQELHRAGLGMNLLLNGNCYGAESLARSFFQRIGDLIDRLRIDLGLGSITTASPVIARFIRQNFPDIEIRASVNMGIGSSEGIEYLSDIMDGFYVERENNRNIETVTAFSEACRSLDKKVYLLANSGCLNHCPARTFHDNLVSHEMELMKMDNAFAFKGLCRDFMQNASHRRRWIQLTNWIRPEDLCRYEGLVDGIKLATRVSRVPEMIVRAYAGECFSGNLLALMEPDLSDDFMPTVLNAGKFPGDFFEKTSRCDRDCVHCDYCESLYDQIAEPLPDSCLI